VDFGLACMISPQPGSTEIRLNREG